MIHPKLAVVKIKEYVVQTKRVECVLIAWCMYATRSIPFICTTHYFHLEKYIMWFFTFKYLGGSSYVHVKDSHTLLDRYRWTSLRSRSVCRQHKQKSALWPFTHVISFAKHGVAEWDPSCACGWCTHDQLDANSVPKQIHEFTNRENKIRVRTQKIK